VGPVRPLLEIPGDTKHVAALIRMQSAQADLARVVDADRNTLGVLTLRSLRDPLLRGGR
jgi:CBS domain containing-hemolysin-like protein